MTKRKSLEYIRNTLIKEYKYFKINALKLKERKDSRGKERYMLFNGNVQGLTLAMNLLGINVKNIYLN